MKKQSHFTFIGKFFSVFETFLSILSYLGITLSVLWGFFKKNFWMIIPFTIFSGILICVFLCKKYHVELIKKFITLFAINCPYKYVRYKATYEYESMEQMKLHTTYLVKALQTGVEFIRVRFNWSGATEKNPVVPSIISNGEYETDRIEFEKSEYGYNCYKLYSKNKCNKNDPPVKMGVDLGTLVVKDKKISHHLQACINVITDSLELEIILPFGIYPSKVCFLEYLHSTDDEHWHKFSDSDYTKPKLENEKWVIRWVIEKPVFGGKYIIEFDPEVKQNI